MKSFLSRIFPPFYLLLAVSVSATIRYVDVNSATPVSPYADWSTAATKIQDAIDAADPGDQILVTNGVYKTGGRVVYGSQTNRVAINKAVTVQSVNGPGVTAIMGYQVPGTVYGSNAMRCVYMTNGATLVGFSLTNGATRGGGDINNESSGGGVWCASPSAVLSNCVLVANSSLGYGGGAYGGTLNNCKLVSNSTSTGSGFIATGGGAYMSLLNGCLVTNNSAGYIGGGVFGGTLNNCTVVHNSSDNGGGVRSSILINCFVSANTAPQGGGASYGTLSNCTLSANVGNAEGGGAWRSALYNCVITGNTSQAGAGAAYGALNNCVLTGNMLGVATYSSALTNCTVVNNSSTSSCAGSYAGSLANCILYYNTGATTNTNYFNCYGTPNYCCTTPLPTNGVGNVSNEPGFADLLGGNFRLQTSSPCINAGNNAFVAGATDLDGRPRIVGGTVDIGAYEFQGAGIGEFIAWLQQYSLPTDGSADYADPDGDTMNNWQEWICGTDPTNALSVLRMLPPAPGAPGIAVSWQSVTNRSYFLQRATNLSGQPVFLALATNIAGQFGTTTFLDTNSTGGAQLFYRVGIQQ